MKKLLVFSIFSLLLGVVAAGLYVAPYHYYATALSRGIDTSYLSVSVGKSALYEGGDYRLKRMKGLINEDETRWEAMHFADYVVPVPFRHPVYFLKPEVEILKNGKSRFGFVFIDQKGRDFSQVKTMTPFDFEFRLGRDLIFQLPLVKNYIMAKSNREIWRDLFRLDLIVGPEDPRSYYELFQQLRHLSYEELAYRLFIYRTRRSLFGEDVKKISYYKSSGFGVIRYENPKLEQADGFIEEVVHILHRGVIHRVSISYLEGSIEAEAYRRRFFQTLELKVDDPDSSIPIYTFYKQLSFEERISHQGMIYLYMAWSHVPEKKQFLREMIQFLERGGEDNSLFLTSLYDYAYKKFGTSFSTKEHLKEKPRAKLERKISEEIKKENRKIRRMKMDVPQEDFESVDKKMEYYLNRAKKKGLDKSGEKDTLIMQ